jgi:phage terminase Nu1 subunit (DNA packaging protein)
MIMDDLNMTVDLTELIRGGTAMSEESTAKNLVRSETIGQLFGLSVRRIQQLDEEKIIEHTIVVENGRQVRKYDLIPTAQKYIKYLSDKAYGKAHRTDKEIELREQKMEADIALRESQGELHRLKTAIAAGDYISIEEVKLDYAKFFVVFKKFAMSLPNRIGGMLSGSLEPLEQRRVEKEISDEIAELLNSFVVAGIAKPKDVKEILSGEKP